jgi:hypothetical protein
MTIRVDRRREARDEPDDPSQVLLEVCWARAALHGNSKVKRRRFVRKGACRQCRVGSTMPERQRPILRVARRLDT